MSSKQEYSATPGGQNDSAIGARLSDKHFADLRSSGLSVDTILDAGFHTLLNPDQVNSLLSRNDGNKLGPCLMIPYFDPDGNQIDGYVRAKPDNPPGGKMGKPAKYLSPVKATVRAYFPPGAGNSLKDPDQPIVFTEGEKKALSVWQLGVPAVAFAGVECWSKPRPKGSDGKAFGMRELLDDVSLLPLKGRIIYIVYDSDICGNRCVLKAEQSLARTLTERGAIVKLVRIPHTIDGRKLGIDDFLAGQADPAAALASLFEIALEFGASKRKNAEGQYRLRNGHIVREVFTREGLVETPLCNFAARIVEEVFRDDGGGEPSVIYEIEGELAGGEKLPRINVPSERFSAMNWPTEQWRAGAYVFAGFGAKDHLRVAILSLSDPIRRTVYSHLGWREIEGRWYFLQAGGAIGETGANASICCEPPGPLRGFDLPDPRDQEAVRDAVRSSLKLVNGRIPDRITFPLLAAVYRAPLGQSDFSVHLSGPTGAYKTELAALAEQHFGPQMDSRNLPGSWSSTGNALEGLAFFAKDVLLVVDDFAPAGRLGDVQRINRDAERFFRAQGNNSGRLRMTSSAQLREGRPPRGLTLSTGEDVPTGQSIRARLVTIEVERGDIATAVLTEDQQDASAGQYALSMAGFVCHLASRYAEIRKTVKAKREEFRDQFFADCTHARTPTAVADLSIGLWYFLDFAVQVGAIALDERNEVWKRGMVAFRYQARAQTDNISTADPVVLYVRLLQACVVSGRGYLAGPDGNIPATDPIGLGWRPRSGASSGGDWQPLGRQLGWIDGEIIYLDPESAYAEVQKMATDQGQSITTTSRTLHKRMHEAGLLMRISKTGDTVRYAVRVTLAGCRRDVLCLAATTLFPPGCAPIAPDDERPAPGVKDPERTANPEGGKTNFECAKPNISAPSVRQPDSLNNEVIRADVAHLVHSANEQATDTFAEAFSPWQ